MVGSLDVLEEFWRGGGLRLGGASGMAGGRGNSGGGGLSGVSVWTPLPRSRGWICVKEHVSAPTHAIPGQGTARILPWPEGASMPLGLSGRQDGPTRGVGKASTV